MLAKEIEALPDVAGIGLQRLRRQPPLALQMRQPARHLQRDALIGAGELDRLDCRFGHGSSNLILLNISHLRLYRSLTCGRGGSLEPSQAILMDDSTRQTSSTAASTGIVDVLVPVALNQTYSYRVPRGMELQAGDVVGVPLGPREVLAVVWAENANPDPRLHNRLKDVSEKLDVPPLKEELRSLVDWVSNYTLSARGMVLRMALRMGEHLGPERLRMGVRLIGE